MAASPKPPSTDGDQKRNFARSVNLGSASFWAPVSLGTARFPPEKVEGGGESAGRMGRGVGGRRGGGDAVPSLTCDGGGRGKGGLGAGWRTKAMTLGDHSSSRSLAPPLTHSVIPLLARRWSGIRTLMHEWGGKEAKKGPPRVDKGEKVEGGDIDFSSPAKGKKL